MSASRRQEQPPLHRMTTSTSNQSNRNNSKRPYKLKREMHLWGEYKSIVKARSTEFNLKLDIQTLRQEIEQLVTARSILEQKVLMRRHDTTGSLMQIVQEWFRLFRSGYDLESMFARARAPDLLRQRTLEQIQVDFSHAVMDERVDCDSGGVGVERFLRDTIRHSLCFKLIEMNVVQTEVVQTDDAVIISATSNQRFAITEKTIEEIFPHLLPYRDLVRDVVGAELKTTGQMVFYFNNKDQIAKFRVNTDMITGLMGVIQDAQYVHFLMQHANLRANGAVVPLLEDSRPTAESSTSNSAAGSFEIML